MFVRRVKKIQPIPFQAQSNRGGFSRRGRGGWNTRARRGSPAMRSRNGFGNRNVPMVDGRPLTDYCREWNNHGVCVWEGTQKGCLKLHACNLCGSKQHQGRHHGQSSAATTSQ